MVSHLWFPSTPYTPCIASIATMSVFLSPFQNRQGMFHSIHLHISSVTELPGSFIFCTLSSSLPFFHAWRKEFVTSIPEICCYFSSPIPVPCGPWASHLATYPSASSFPVSHEALSLHLINETSMYTTHSRNIFSNAPIHYLKFCDFLLWRPIRGHSTFYLFSKYQNFLRYTPFTF